MKQNVTWSDFLNAFSQSDRRDQFTYDGLKALFTWLEEWEENTGEEIQFDMIALCCEYTEYKNLKEFNEAYGKEFTSLDQVEYETYIIPVFDDEFTPTSSFIIQDF